MCIIDVKLRKPKQWKTDMEIKKAGNFCMFLLTFLYFCVRLFFLEAFINHEKIRFNNISGYVRAVECRPCKVKK